ncbi:MAG: carbonic anhydrase [Bacteroidales bacterium]|nr:carbonic anhydrase [Bacteroidales bacterium]MBN2817355.1 carbonic anhydrase [Bacteroidales bacterium]
MKTSKLVMLSFLTVCLLSSLSAQVKMSPEQVLKLLKEGNERYTDQNRTYPNLNQERLTETSEHGQHPYATIIGCSDSRVPIEHIFDAGIGDIFVIRVAGNVVNTDEAGSIEYGVEHLHTPLFVVLGHSSCGAITAVATDAELHGNIPKLVENIKPAVTAAHEEHGEEFSEELLNTAIKNNVFQSIEDLFEKSQITKELVESGKLMVIGAIYHLNTGKVEWLGEHPKQEELVAN